MKYSAKPEDLWRRQKAKLQLYFPQLTEDDFRYDYGMKDVMMTKLQLRLGKSREELNELLTQL